MGWDLLPPQPSEPWAFPAVLAAAIGRLESRNPRLAGEPTRVAPSTTAELAADFADAAAGSRYLPKDESKERCALISLLINRAASDQFVVTRGPLSPVPTRCAQRTGPTFA